LARVPALAKLAPLAAALALAAGCGGDDETTTSAATGSTTTTTETSSATGPGGSQTTTADGTDGGSGGGGGNGGSGGSGAAGATPEGALEAFFTSGDPAIACGEVVTPQLVASAYGDEQGCRAAQVPGATPKSIEITELEESGEAAEAVVVPEGGPNDGFDHEVTLVREGDAWLVDSLDADIPAGP
jgi:hypothetical protein